MSKNITIKEGGVGKNLTADKLETNLTGTGACRWIPEDAEDAVALGTKNITENGTYKARDDGYYGYKEVTVSGIGKTFGKGSDGEMHSVSVDANGDIVDQTYPSSIKILTPPDKLTYTDGEIIDLTGIVVMGYLADGVTEWGVVPIEELYASPSTASAEGGERRGGTYNEYPNMTEVLTHQVPLSGKYHMWYGTTGNARVVLFTYGGNISAWSVPKENSDGTVVRGYMIDSDKPPRTYSTYSSVTRMESRTGAKIVNGDAVQLSHVFYDTAANAYSYAWGEQASAGGQVIKVLWPLPAGQQYLEDEYLITVNAAEP